MKAYLIAIALLATPASPLMAQQSQGPAAPRATVPAAASAGAAIQQPVGTPDPQSHAQKPVNNSDTPPRDPHMDRFYIR